MAEITKTGPLSWRELKQLNLSSYRPKESDYAWLEKVAANRKNSKGMAATFSTPSVRDITDAAARQGYGTSKYDAEATPRDIETGNLQNVRAASQSALSKYASGLAKMAVTAGTTFVDGTLGAVTGIATGLYNTVDGDPNTSFLSGLWNNAVSNAMADINKEMEEIAPNYMSSWEQNASVFERMGTANFWANDVIKNIGFTAGAAASIVATGGATAALKGVKALGNVGRALGLVGKTGEATRAGKVVNTIVKGWASTQGESAIEAINSYRDNMEVMNNNFEARKENLLQQAAEEAAYNIANGMGEEEAESLYNAKVQQINNGIEYAKAVAEKEAIDASNMTYGLNVAILSLSNAISLGSLIRGGYGNASKLLQNAVKTSNGEAITTARQAGRALLNGTLRFEAPEVKNATAKIIGRAGLQSLSEGLEEASQNLASSTTQIVSQADVNKDVKKHTMLGTMINPDAAENLSNWGQALTQAYEANFGATNASGWSEFIAGAIGGIIGAPGPKRKSNGKMGIGWAGGFSEAREAILGQQKAIAKQTDWMNGLIQDRKFGDRVKHAVQQLAIKDGQTQALANKDIYSYKNLEIQQLLSDAIFFRNQGMLDDYLGMFESMSEGVSDEDVAELRAAVKQVSGGIENTDALDKMTDDEIKQLYQDKAKSTIDKINRALKDYDSMYDKYADKFSPEIQDTAIMEMSYLESAIQDNLRRKDILSREKEELDRKKEDNTITPLESIELEERNKGIKELEEGISKMSSTLSSYQENPEKLAEDIQKQKDHYAKLDLYKKTDNAIKAYQDATTLQEAVDVYLHTPEEDAEAILKQAISKTEGETKARLQQLDAFISDATAVTALVDSKFPINLDPNKEITAEDQRNLALRRQFQRVVSDVVNEMLNDESPVLNRETLKQKLNKTLDSWKEIHKEAFEQSRGLEIKDGQIDIAKAKEAGLLGDEDIESVINPVDGSEYNTIKEDSEVNALAYHAEHANTLKGYIDQLQDIIDSLDKLDEFKQAAKPAPKENIKRASQEVTKKPSAIESSKKKTEEKKPVTTKKTIKTPKIDVKGASNYFDVVPKKGKSGVTYFGQKLKHPGKEVPDSVKNPMLGKGKHVSNQIQALATQVTKNTSDEDKQKIIEELLNIAENTVLFADQIKLIEGLFEKLGYTHTEETVIEKPDTSKTSSKSTDTAESEDNLSLEGNVFNAYSSSELKQGKVVYYKSSPISVWMIQHNLFPQSLVDNYLGILIEQDEEKDIKDRTPIHYLYHSDNTVEDVVFLGIEYTDEVSSVIPRDKVTPIEVNGKPYIIIGTLGYYGQEKNEEKKADSIAMFDSLRAERPNNFEGWAINEEHSNRIKGISGGQIVNQTVNDKERTLYDVRDLLQGTRNPHNLEKEDIGFTIIEGNNEQKSTKAINSDESKVYSIKLDSDNVQPGQVYMHVPAANGMFVPVLIEPSTFSQLSETSPLYTDIKKLVETLVSTESSVEEKREAIGKIRDALNFSNVNQIYYNEENPTFGQPNSITVTVNGEPEVIVDFASGTGTVEEVLNAITRANPTIKLDINTLRTNIDLYLESGILKTDIASLSTYGAKFWLYPVDSNNDYYENKPREITGEETYHNDGSIKTGFYLNGNRYFYDGQNITDSSGNIVEDTDGTLSAARKIRGRDSSVTTIKRGNKVYYYVDNTMLLDNGHGGFCIISEEKKQEVLEKQKASDTKKKKESNKKNHKRITVWAEEDSEEKKEEKPSTRKKTSPTPKTKVIDLSEDETPPYAQEVERKEEKKPVTAKPKKSIGNGTSLSSEASAEELENLALSSSPLAAVLKKRANAEKKKQIDGIAKTKFKVDIHNNAERMVFLKDKGISLDTEDLDSVIDNLNSCKK